MDLSDTKPGDWVLLGAGRANAVFAYKGKRQDLANHVLRLSKPRQEQRPPASAALEAEVWRDYPQLLRTGPERALAFVNTIIAPKLMNRYLPEQAEAKVSPKLVAGLMKSIGLPISDVQLTALVLPNNTLFRHASAAPTVCVEVKPKWGGLPTSPCVHPDNSLKLHTSKFQLQQALKLSKGKINRLGGYDPLDLYSGEAAAVTRALWKLLEDPQNNLRLFRNGRTAPLSSKDSEEGPAQLTTALQGWCPAATPQQTAATLTAALQAVLKSEAGRRWATDVLQQLLRIQQLDVHDIEGVLPVYDALLEHYQQQGAAAGQAPMPPEGTPQSPTTPGRDGASADGGSSPGEAGTPPGRAPVSPVAAVPHSCRRGRRCSAAQRIEALAAYETAHARLLSLSRSEQCAILRDYMTAATAKDCSVMIALRPLPGSNTSGSSGGDSRGGDAHGSVEVDGQRFEYKVSVADLDLKPLEKVEEHRQLDQNILHAAKKQRERQLLSA